MNFRTKTKSNPFQLLALMGAAVVFGVLSTGCNPDETQVVANFDTTITLQEEFDVAGAPNDSIWGYDEGTGSDGWGNNELQYYTKRADNVVVEDGMLKITAIKEAYEGSDYTSARILTKGKFAQQYGRFEARIKVPSGKGFWPAFWMLGANHETVGWPQCGEIDIMENRGSEPTIIGGSLHGPGYSGGNPVTKEYQLMSDRFDTGFHVFGVEWTEDYVNYYVDDVLYNQITRDDVSGEWVFDQPFFIVLNLAVGGNYDGAPSDDTEFPQQMLVDYVRVYAAE
jgi:beta-glucanase (GH16 family)